MRNIFLFIGAEEYRECKMIKKIQCNPLNYKINMFYYHRARDAMFDAVQQLVEKGYKNIFIPGYIGWSPKEGSGIFDPINKIEGLNRYYYKITKDLAINIEALKHSLQEKSILLIVNYFGFRDRLIKQVIQIAKEKDCVVIEDNAHGFFTFFCNETVGSDLTFFSLHKLFPFGEGGSLLLLNDKIDIQPQRNLKKFKEIMPFEYDINGIARKRKENFQLLMRLMKGNEAFFIPLKTNDDLIENTPQTFPIIVKHGNRDKIYEIMNERGFGVVSLYHTMIEELRTEEHNDACWLSRHIMNLPVHQDVDSGEYEEMIAQLKSVCID